jgi:hypothetical protein
LRCPPPYRVIVARSPSRPANPSRATRASITLRFSQGEARIF